MKHIAQILSFSLALILAITFTTPVFADTNPPEDTAHAYHFRTAKEYDAPRYVLNCHTNGAVVSGTKVSLWQATGDISQEWYVDWTSYGQYNRTAVLRSIRSAVKLCKTFLPAMAKARQGRVLFMLTSYLLGAPPKNTAAYVMVKSTLQGLAKSLAADYASFDVTVNCVMPSMMETKFLADTSDLIVQASAEANPMKRNARVEDVVPAMAFLLSEEAGFITGVTLPVTGGSAFL